MTKACLLVASVSTFVFLPSCSQNAIPVTPVNPKTDVKADVDNKGVPLESGAQTNPQRSKPPSSKGGWIVATVRTDGGEAFFRFNHGRRDLADNPAYSQMIVFETTPTEAKNIDEHLRSLDVLEDAIKTKMEAINGCIMMQARTGADYRDLTFAYGGKTKAFDGPIKELISEFPNRMNVHVQNADWQLFKKLVEAK